MRKSYFLPLKGLLCVLSFGIMGISQAQPGSVTTDQLNIERLLIEASQEKLLGAYDEAIATYLQVLEKDKDNDAAAYEISRIYENQEKYDDALSYIKKAVRLVPENEWYQVMQADILEKKEEYQESAKVYEGLTVLNPKQTYYFEHLVDLYRNTAQYDQALNTLDRFEQQAGITHPIIRAKFEILDQLGRTDKAIETLDKLVRVYPRNIEYLHLAATYCKQKDKNKQANVYYQKILALDSNDSRANIAMANTFKDQGEDISYLNSIKPILSNPAINLDIKIQELIPFAEKLAAQANPDLAATCLGLIQILEVEHPNEAKVYALKGDLLYHNGDLSEARRAYEKTLTLDQSVFAVWEQLLYLQLEQEDPQAVVRTAENAMDVFPNQAIIYYLSGIAQMQQKNYFEARSALEEALLMSGRDEALKLKILSNLGNIYQETGQPEKSYAAFDKALAIQKDNPAVLNDYAYALAIRNAQIDKALQHAQSAAKTSPDNPRIEHTLAWIYFQKQDLEMARKWIEKSIIHGGSSDAVTLEHQGDILFSLNEVDAAVNAWQASLDKGNPSEIIRRKIAERKIVH